MEENKFDQSCPCGSEMAYGACCGQEEKCPCGSDLPAGECCYQE